MTDRASLSSFVSQPHTCLLIVVCMAVSSALVITKRDGTSENALLGEDYLMLSRDVRCANMTDDGGYRSCARFGSSSALVPNFLNHESLQEANSQLLGFKDLVATKCSRELPFLLCSYHFPGCQPTAPREKMTIVTPCRELCERVKNSCLPVLENYNLSWPEGFRCDKLQNNSYGREILTGPQGERIVCMDGPPPGIVHAETTPFEVPGRRRPAGDEVRAPLPANRQNDKESVSPDAGKADIL